MSEKIALYARVSSEKQVQSNTIDSQIASLKERIRLDSHTLLSGWIFVDDGYSGSTLMRPELERLRDCVVNEGLEKIYVHSPDRLARKYAYQYLLIEEFKQSGVEVVFLNDEMGKSPESDLLLQLQGIIAEYERMKIMERSRRGKRHSAQQGLVKVLAAAPYGYRYIGKQEGNGHGAYEVISEEAEIVRQMFDGVANKRWSLNEVTRYLARLGKPTRRGNPIWDRGTVLHILKNPAYKGAAAFGKTKIIPRLPHLRAHRNRTLHSKRASSIQNTPKQEWISIPVPAIVEESVFEMVQEQLEENKKRKREQKGKVGFLLRGLLVCKKCQYAYSGNGTSYRSSKRSYGYYICVGGKKYCYRDRFCDNSPVRSDYLEQLVWEEIKILLKDPEFLEKEYQRRLQELEKTPKHLERDRLMAREKKLQKMINRLIDAYSEGLIEKIEFSKRIKSMRSDLTYVRQCIQETEKSSQSAIELQVIIGQLQEFSARVSDQLHSADKSTKRYIIQALIKRIEVDEDEINIVFRIDPHPTAQTTRKFSGDCDRSH